MVNLLGFAIRRENLCSSSMGEVDCGPTWGNFRACCPGGAYCPSTRDPGYYNAECCDEPNVNCTQTILDEGPFCADTSWIMYDNYGYFCCDPALEGLSNGFGVGCANESTYTLGAGQEWLTSTAVQQSKPSESPSSAPIPNPPQSSSGGLGAGAIAGIVVGCVAAVVLAFLAGLFLMRRRRSKRKASVVSTSEASASESAGKDDTAAQKVEQRTATDGEPGSAVTRDVKVDHGSEYPPEKVQRYNEPIELPADSRPSEVPGSPVHPSSFQAEKPG